MRVADKGLKGKAVKEGRTRRGETWGKCEGRMMMVAKGRGNKGGEFVGDVRNT